MAMRFGIKSATKIKALVTVMKDKTKLNWLKEEAPAKRTRKVKQYKNPHTGETIETKGGNHKTLKEWKATWGGDTVEGWATVLG